MGPLASTDKGRAVSKCQDPLPVAVRPAIPANRSYTCMKGHRKNLRDLTRSNELVYLCK